MENLTFTFTNTFTKATVEIFNALNTFVNIRNRAYEGRSGNFYSYKPYDVYPTPVSDFITFTENGDIYLTGNAGVLFGVTMSCEEYPMRSLIEAMKTRSIQIHLIKITAPTQLQLIETITRIEYVPLSNKYFEKHYYPTIPPDQVQGTMIDFKEKIMIDGNSGLTFQLEAATTVKWDMSFEILNYQL